MINFVADVRVVSDESADRENPIQRLSQELLKRAVQLSKKGVRGDFHFRVGGIDASPWKGVYKTKLSLPAPHEFPRYIFDKNFQEYIRAIRREPSEVRHLVINNSRANVSIVFTPGAGGTHGYTHPPYKFAHDIEHNVVYQALNRKADQIKRAGGRDSHELAGIILCDGGCHLLRTTPGVGAVSLNQIIKTFLRRSHTVTFVCVVDSYQASLGLNSSRLTFEARFWAAQHLKALETLCERLNDALQNLPIPVRSGGNTVNHYEWARGSKGRLYSDYRRGASMSQNAVELSLRATIEYLAGRIDRSEYERWVPIDWLHQLKRNLECGSQITEVSISRSPDRDDDILVITFGEPDPAMSPFGSGKGKAPA